METRGSLCDKLAIVNIRLWHLEDKRRDMSLSDAERLGACDKVSAANAKRNRLIDEIDALADEAIKDGEAPKSEKLKMYKGE